MRFRPGDKVKLNSINEIKKYGGIYEQYVEFIKNNQSKVFVIDRIDQETNSYIFEGYDLFYFDEFCILGLDQPRMGDIIEVKTSSGYWKERIYIATAENWEVICINNAYEELYKSERYLLCVSRKNRRIKSKKQRFSLNELTGLAWVDINEIEII